MNNIKARKTITLLHLFAATLLAPFLILVAVTGGLYVADIKPEVKQTKINLIAGVTLDPNSETIDDDVRQILADNDIDVKFEYIRSRDNSATTRPTSRTHVSFEKDDLGWSATLNEPNFHYAMMELHKGHGPQLFKTYQIIAAITLAIIMLSGLFIGLLSKSYRTKTIGSTIIGSFIFIILAFII